MRIDGARRPAAAAARLDRRPAAARSGAAATPAAAARACASRSRFGRRGARTLPPPALVLRDPFGARPARGRRAASADERVLVLPRVHPVTATAARATRRPAHARAALIAAAEIELDGLRPTARARRPRASTGRAAPAAPGCWSASCSPRPTRGRWSCSTRARRQTPRPSTPPCGPRPRWRSTSRKRGGCSLLLPGDRRATASSADGRGWPAVHARLALVDGARSGAAPRRPPRAATSPRAVDHVAARARADAGRLPARVPGTAHRRAGSSSSCHGYVGPRRGSAAAWRGCSGYVLASGARRGAAGHVSAACGTAAARGAPAAPGLRARAGAPSGPLLPLADARGLRVRRAGAAARCLDGDARAVAGAAAARCRRVAAIVGLLAAARLPARALAVVAAPGSARSCCSPPASPPSCCAPGELERPADGHPARDRATSRASRVPYAGVDPWSRLVIPLGGGLLVAVAGADRVLAAARAQRARPARRAGRAAAALRRCPSSRASFPIQFLRGAMFAVLVAAFLRLERVRPAARRARRRSSRSAPRCVGAARRARCSTADRRGRTYETWALDAAASGSRRLRLGPPLRPAELAARRSRGAARQGQARRPTGRPRTSTASTACAGCTSQVGTPTR